MSKRLQIPVILAALRRHKSHVAIICLQIAFTMAVLANLVFVIVGDMHRYRTPTGIPEDNVGIIQSIGAIGVDNTGTAIGNLYELRSIPGVAKAAVGPPPLWRPKAENIYTDVDRLHAISTVYKFQGSQGYGDTLGVRVVAGRPLVDGDSPDIDAIDAHTVFPALVTRALADRLFPGANPLGQKIVDGSSIMRIVGIVDHLRAQITGAADDDYAVITQFGVGQQDIGGSYILRTVPGVPVESVLDKAAAVSAKSNPGHVVQLRKSMVDLRSDYFQGDKAKNRMIMAVLAILLVVAAFGLGGISAYWVQQRRRQIGVMRALGATRGDVIFYFQVENLLIVAAGWVIGVGMTYLGNHLLMIGFEIPRIQIQYVVIGVVCVWVLGQLSALLPALQAARIAPASASQ